MVLAKKAEGLFLSLFYIANPPNANTRGITVNRMVKAGAYMPTIS